MIVKLDVEKISRYWDVIKQYIYKDSDKRLHNEVLRNLLMEINYCCFLYDKIDDKSIIKGAFIAEVQVDSITNIRRLHIRSGNSDISKFNIENIKKDIEQIKKFALGLKCISIEFYTFNKPLVDLFKNLNISLKVSYNISIGV